MVECNTKSIGCENEATIRSFWPGRSPALICLECAARRERIAKTLGFDLHQEPIKPDKEDEHL